MVVAWSRFLLDLDEHIVDFFFDLAFDACAYLADYEDDLPGDEAIASFVLPVCCTTLAQSIASALEART